VKAIRIHAYGNSDQLQVEEVERPQLAADQVFVRIHDAGVNPIDWKIREGFGKERFPLDFPATVGQDFAGEVLAIGTAVKGFAVGDDVYGFAHGSYAEFAAVQANEIALKPKGLDFVAAASIPTPALTAWQCLIDTAQIRKGQTILIHGAGGGVGSFACQIAKWKGARVTATAGKDDFKFLNSIGVDKIINYKTEHFEKLVRDFDIVLDLVGGETQEKSLSLLKKGGMIVTTVGGLNQDKIREQCIIGNAIVMRKEARALEQIAELVNEGKIKTHVGEVLPLADAAQAQDLLQKGQAHGKVVLHI
jgi:NADPH:quinone reductase-like Zn-dependent oxidoreductase